MSGPMRVTTGELIEELRRRLAPSLNEHDERPARYWAERMLELDADGRRVPTLADCDWPKEHLRRALDALDELRSALYCWPMTEGDWKRAHGILDRIGARR